MDVGPTRFSICTRAMPAIPLTSDVTRVNSRFNSACSTLAFAARTGRLRSALGLSLGVELAPGNRAGFGQRRVALDNRGNFDVWRGRWRRGSAAAAAADDHKQAGQQRPAGQPLECLHADHFEGIKPDAGARIYQTKVLERAERRAFCLPPRRPSSSSKVSAKRGGGRPLPTQTPQIELTPWPPSGVERVCSATRPSS